MSFEQFREVVAATPLVSVDLVVRNHRSELLLGRRLNRPAQGSWFVPGGRIRKDETLDAAFLRITQGELGTPFPRSSARFLGVFEHFYPDSVFGEAPGTHYVVLAYLLSLDADALPSLPHGQHDRYEWWTDWRLRHSPDVHANTRAYLG